MTLRFHTLGSLIDTVERAMRARYGARIAPSATAWLINLCGVEPSREAEA